MMKYLYFIAFLIIRFYFDNTFGHDVIFLVPEVALNHPITLICFSLLPLVTNDSLALLGNFALGNQIGGTDSFYLKDKIRFIFDKAIYDMLVTKGGITSDDLTRNIIFLNKLITMAISPPLSSVAFCPKISRSPSLYRNTVRNKGPLIETTAQVFYGIAFMLRHKGVFYKGGRKMSFLVRETAQRLKKSSLIQLDQLIGSLFVKKWGILIAQATILKLMIRGRLLKALVIQAWGSLRDED